MGSLTDSPSFCIQILLWLGWIALAGKERRPPNGIILHSSWSLKQACHNRQHNKRVLGFRGGGQASPRRLRGEDKTCQVIRDSPCFQPCNNITGVLGRAHGPAQYISGQLWHQLSDFKLRSCPNCQRFQSQHAIDLNHRCSKHCDISCKKGKGHQNRAPSLLEPRVFF